MMRKIVHSLYANNIYSCNKVHIRYSALFINGPKATDTFVYLTPHIDFADRIKHKEILERELIRRNSNIDLTKIENLWLVYNDLKKKKNSLEKKKDEIFKAMSTFMTPPHDSNEANKLKFKLDLIKENIKKIKAPLWSAEEIAVIESLKLPNKLHPLTPDVENKVLFSEYTMPSNTKNHLSIGKDLNLLNFTKNENYYLKNDAAIFELGAKFFFSHTLRKNDFIQFSNPDFVKSLIMEGCGEDHTDADSSFILHHNEDTKVNVDSRLHLTGAGSLFSFFAYHAKNVLHRKYLPLKYFSIGRQYKPSPDQDDCLFHVSQSSVIQTFEIAKCADDLDTLLQELIDVVRNCYKELGYHFRLSIVSADKLCMWESLRIAIEMYSSSLKGYVEVGHISLTGDFISKRLMLTFIDNKQSNFPHILSGTILNVPKFLACVLEQDGDFVLPELLKVENWKL